MDVLADHVGAEEKKIALKFYCLDQWDKKKILKLLSKPAVSRLEACISDIERMGVKSESLRELLYGTSTQEGDSPPGASWPKLISKLERAQDKGELIPSELLAILKKISDS